MIEAPTLSDVKKRQKHIDDAMCCILIAPLFSKVGKEVMIPRIGYLNHRSGMNIHFYCAGYGAGWSKTDHPDMEDADVWTDDKGTKTHWLFSQHCFAQFLDELEDETTWKYSGEAEVIVMGPVIDFSQCLILNIEQMLKDDAINQYSELFEALIQYAKKNHSSPSAYQFSDMKGSEQLGIIAIEAILSIIPTPAKNLWERGKHYAIKDISR